MDQSHRGLNWFLDRSRLVHYDNKNVQNFVIEHLKLHNSKNCYQCKISKLKKKLFYNTINKADKPLELIHTDVVRKLENSYNDFNYYVTFLNDFSRKHWVYLIKNKSNVYDIFF